MEIAPCTSLKLVSLEHIYLKVYYIQSSYVKWMSHFQKTRLDVKCMVCFVCLSVHLSLCLFPLFFSPSFHNTFYNRGYSIFRDWIPQQTLAILMSYCKPQGLKNDLSHFFPNFRAEGRTELRCHLLTPDKFWQNRKFLKVWKTISNVHLSNQY